MTLREQHAAATREQILDVAMDLLGRGGFSHESIAAAAGIGARTVYRHFPDRAELVEALWIRLRDASNTRFPVREDEIVPLARAAFGQFDQHDSLIRAVLSSSAGKEVRDRGGAEGRPAFARSLDFLLAGLDLQERAQVIAVFVAIYSAPFWQLLRDRGGLSGTAARDAVAWVLNTLIEGLHKSKQKRGTKDNDDATDRENDKVRRAGRRVGVAAKAR